MADGHGAFSIGRLAPGVRRGLFVAGLAVAVVLAGLPASAHTPETGADPSVSVTVTRSDQLLNGEVVTVTGFGFPVLTDGEIRQCAGTPAAHQCQAAVIGNFRTGSTSHLPATLVAVRRLLNLGGGTIADCSVQACALVATAGSKSSGHHLTFVPETTSSTAGAPPTAPPTAPTTTAAPATTAPTISTATTTPTATTTTTAPVAGLLCDLLGALRRALGSFLGGLLDALLNLFGCPPAG